PGRNHWPPDVGQPQPFRHQTGQLSDQVLASTRNRRAPRRGARGNAPSAAAATSPPAPRVSCAYIILFGSGLAGLGAASVTRREFARVLRLPFASLPHSKPSFPAMGLLPGERCG